LVSFLHKSLKICAGVNPLQTTKTNELLEEEEDEMDDVLVELAGNQLDPIFHLGQPNSTIFKTELLSPGATFTCENDCWGLQKLVFLTANWSEGEAAGDLYFEGGSKCTFEATIIDPLSAKLSHASRDWTDFFKEDDQVISAKLDLVDPSFDLPNSIYISMDLRIPNPPSSNLLRRHSTSALSPGTKRGRILRSLSSDGCFASYASVAARPGVVKAVSPVSPTFRVPLPLPDLVVEDEDEDPYFQDFPPPTSPVYKKQALPREPSVKVEKKPEAVSPLAERRRKSSFGARGRSTSIQGLTRSPILLPVLTARWEMEHATTLKFKYTSSHPVPDHKASPLVQRQNVEYTNSYTLL